MQIRCRSDQSNVLRSPRKLDSGTTIFEAVVVKANTPLQYGWGEEIPTPEALRDSAYLEGFRGAPFSMEHPETPDGKVHADRPLEGKGKVVGTVLSARFDEPSQCVIVEFAVHTEQDAQQIRDWAQVSEGYSTVVDAQGKQIIRINNHLAGVPKGRALDNEVRVDTKLGRNPTMTPEQIAALQKSLVDATERALKAEGELKQAKVRLDQAEKESAAAGKSTAKDLFSLIRSADALGVEVESGEDMTPEGILSALVKALGLDEEKAKNQDYSRGAIDAAVAAKKAASPEEKQDSRTDAQTRFRVLTATPEPSKKNRYGGF